MSLVLSFFVAFKISPKPIGGLGLWNAVAGGLVGILDASTFIRPQR